MTAEGVQARASRSRVLAGAGGLLGREDWIYLLSLLVPLFVYNVALKAIRVATQMEPPGLLGFLDQVRSDVLFNLGYAALWIGLFAILRSGVGRLALLVLFHLSWLLVIVLTTSAHSFYSKTGSTLDWSYVSVLFGSFDELRGLILSEVTPLHTLLISAILLYGTAGPAVVTRLFSRDWHVPTRSTGRPWLAPAAACVAALLFAGLSLLPSASGAGNAFSRDALANILVSEITKPEIKTELAARDLPTDTRLVPTGDAKKRNVVVVFLESTRAESTTPYNEDLETTPFLDELADESLTAERAYAVLPHTSKALVATLCGVPPPLDTRNTESEPDIIPARCLPELMGEQGYKSVFFQSATRNFERRPELLQNMGYDEFYPLESMDKEGYEEVNYFGYEDDIMLPKSREWLEENGEKEPYLATYLTVTAHHDYVVPERYGMQRFADDPLLNRYLNILYYQDRFLEKLFDQYKEMGLYEDTVFVVLGDHGEGFGEHGRYQHDNVIYNEGLRIPLIVHDPKNREPERLEPAVNEQDVLPTVADKLGYRIEGGAYPGTSMLGPVPERTLMASCYQERTCLAAITGDEKYIYHYGNRAEEFFYLSEDPHERENRIGEQDEQEIDDLRNDLLAWEARVKASYESRRKEETPGE